MIPDSSKFLTTNIFLIFERLFENSISLNERYRSTTNDDEMLLVESIIRSYLTHLRSIYSYQPSHSTSSSSLIDSFILIEYNFLQSLEKNLSYQMEYSLDVFAGIDVPLTNTDTFIHSILYDSTSIIKNFVAHFGLIMKNVGQTKVTNVNLRFIRRRKQFIQVLRLEQARKRNDNFAFHVS